MHRVLIFGASGYLGRHLYLHLALSGISVVGSDRGAKPDYFEGEWWTLDTTDSSSWEKVDLTQFDALYFFAGLTGTLAAFEDPAPYLLSNELSLLLFLKAYVSQSAKGRIVFPSTRLVYQGQQGIALREDAPKDFKTVYAVNKLACEMYLQLWGAQYDLDFAIARVCVPYGNKLPGAYSYGTVGFFLAKALAGESIVLYGDGSLGRTFTHVDDLSGYLELIGAHPNARQEVFNLPGDNLTLAEAARLIGAKYGVGLSFVPFPEKDLRIESGDTLFDGSKLLNLLPESFKRLRLSDWVKTL